MKHYTPMNFRCPHMLHGGDYNPDQWRDTPAIWSEDMRLMKLAHCNAMSVGIFAWSALEPHEGEFDFDWLDRIMDMLADNGCYAVLATPSGARPAWMSARYPEILRVREDGIRNKHGLRHNHCLTSPIYREKCAIINRKLAERYGEHPALILWHVSNEYGGECHCDLCQEAFREWLKRKYDNDLGKLNHAWWTSFWSHTFSDWSQIDSPSTRGEFLLHGHALDWKRFVTDQTLDFMCNEIAPLKELSPGVPVTTNLMGTYVGLNARRLANMLDVVSWDSYPPWHKEGDTTATDCDVDLAARIAFLHDLNRGLKGGQPFLLMESVPSKVNWADVCKTKRPGMHRLSSLQAVAHGSDSVQYFQWRKSRGSSEKFHGAVVDHCGHENTRVFREVAEVGQDLETLDEVVGCPVPSDVALIYDWENRWAINDMQALGNSRKKYTETCQNHYRAFWKQNVPVDIIGMEDNFDQYKILIAPMLYMLLPDVAGRIDTFVANGGTFVATYWTGLVDENDLCFLGGFPGPLREVLGIWAEEIDALCDNEVNHLLFSSEKPAGMSDKYEARELCEIIHAETAQILAEYGDDFYAGSPALTANTYGKGQAYYIASRNEQAFLDDFYASIVRNVQPRRALEATLPVGINAQRRCASDKDFVFLMNFTTESKTVPLGKLSGIDLLTGEELAEEVCLPKYGICVIETESTGGG